MLSNRIKSKFELIGKTAIVTGASKGIGESIARGLAEFGSQVVICSRKEEGIREATIRLQKDGLKVHGIAAHVGDPKDREKLIKYTLEQFGGIDILVNNAAVNPYYGPLEEIDLGAFQKTMDVNLLAAMALSNSIMPIMKNQGGGSIIHISSVEGLLPGKGMGGYSISKAALNMLTKSQAREWGAHRIRVNAIAPGLVQTKFSQALWSNPQIMEQLEKNIPMGRAAQPDELSGLAVFLASEAGSYCTGSVIVVDGGLMLGNSF